MFNFQSVNHHVRQKVGVRKGRDRSAKRIVIVAPYSTDIASTRARALAVSDFCESQGVPVRFITTLGPSITRWWLSGGANRLLALPSIVTSSFNMLSALRGAICLIVQRECLPLNSLAIERTAIRRGIPVIWDIDDALWHQDSGHLSWLRGSPSKYKWLAQNASATWAGSTPSEEWVKKRTTKPVHHVPTALSTQQRLESNRRIHNQLVWVGTPATAPFLERLIDRIGQRLEGYHLLVVGARIESPTSMRVECVPWSPAMEHRALSSASIGLYPIDRSKFTDGKSGGKAILYMTYGIPQVATNSPPVKEVLSESGAAFIVDSDDEWIQALEALKDPFLRRTMGANGRAHAENHFNVLTWNEWRLSSLMAVISSHQECFKSDI